MKTRRAGRGPRSLLRRACFCGALGAAVLVVFQPYVHAQVAPELPDSFAGAASTSALNLSLLTPALVPVEDLFDVHLAEGRGTYESDNQEARASLLFGGNGAVLGPSLLCETFLGPQAPPEFRPFIDACSSYQYPLAVFVDPLKPDAQTEGAGSIGNAGDPFSVKAVGARAHAGIDATTTSAEISDVRLLGAPALGSLGSLLETAVGETPDTTLVAVDGVTATTDQRIIDGALVLDARATVSGLRLLGGIVRIASIHSHSRLALTPDKDPVPTTTFEIGAVEVAGRPATIGEDGLVLADSSSGPLQDRVNGQVAELLGDVGLQLTVLPAETDDGEMPSAGIGGLVIELATPIDGLPPVPGPTGDADLNGRYGVRLQIGTTGVRGFADDFSDDLGPAPIDSGVGSGFGSAPLPDVGAPSTPGVGAEPGAEPGNAGGTGNDRSLAQTPVSTLFADRLRLLYLVFTLTGIGLCLMPRLTLPARLPAADG